MSELTKKQKKHLRELSDIAYERDLSRCLEVLDRKFKEWNNNEISVWDLNQAIHEFHNEVARELYKSYTMLDIEFSVAFGIVQGVITLDDVNEGCRERVSNIYNALSERS